MKRIFSLNTFYNNSKEDTPFSEAVNDYYIKSNRLKLYVPEGFNNFFLDNFNISSKDFVKKWKLYKAFINKVYIEYASSVCLGVEIEFTTVNNSLIFIQFMYDNLHNSFKLYKYSFNKPNKDPNDYEMMEVEKDILDNIYSSNEFPFDNITLFISTECDNKILFPVDSILCITDDDGESLSLCEMIIGECEKEINISYIEVDSYTYDFSRIIYYEEDNQNIFYYFDCLLKQKCELKDEGKLISKVPSYIVHSLYFKSYENFKRKNESLAKDNLKKGFIKSTLKAIEAREPEIKIVGLTGIIPTFNNYKLINVIGNSIIVNNKETFDLNTEFGVVDLINSVSSALDDLRLNNTVSSWIKAVEDAISEKDDVKRKSFLDTADQMQREDLTVFEKESEVFKETKEKLDDYLNTYSNIDFLKINKIKFKIDALINSSTTDKTDEIEEVYSIVNKLRTDEVPYAEPYINKLSDYIINFLNKENNISEYRRVFIHKNAFNEFKRFDSNVRNEIEKIVKNLKTYNKFDLMKYLINLQLNTPYNRINYKIRVGNINPYRICFWFGKDLIDRTETKNDIYIYHFVSSDHDEDIKKMKDMKPLKYQENDFTLFNKEQDQNRIYQPELKNKQFLVSNAKEGPMVIFGCAGSGKTSISIDQYFKLYKENEKDARNDIDYIAYVTFIDGLKKNAESYIKTYEVEPNCFTITEYFKYVSNYTKNDKKESNEITFTNWFNEKYTNENLNKFGNKDRIKYITVPDKARFIYTYYRGFFKGSKTLYKKLFDELEKYKDRNKKYSRTLSKEEFMKEVKAQEEVLTDNVIENIYTISKEYYDSIKDEYYDDNDWALYFLKENYFNNSRKFMNIIVDEVQDLTSIELHALLKSLNSKSKNIFFYGDPHQTVNPTVFDDSILNYAVSEVLNETLKKSEELNEVHRTSENLKEYLVFLQNRRTEWLGKYMDNKARIIKDDSGMNDRLLSSNKDEIENNVDIDNWGSYILDDDGLAKKAMELAIESAGVILVPDIETKINLMNKIDKNLASRIITIYDAKGMEWSKVVLYNMLSSAKTYYMDMINGKAKRSTICRMFFNKFYVACTRARDTFVVIENDLTEEIKDKMLSPFPIIEKETQIKLYFDGTATFNEWINDAQRLIKNGNLESAKYAVAKASELAKTYEQKRRVYKLSICAAQDLFPQETNLEMAEECLKSGEYMYAENIFLRKKMYNEYNLTLLFQEKQIKKKEYLDNLINSGLMEKYPESYLYLEKQKTFLELLNTTYNNFVGDKNNG